ncbi:TonB C-terminal domain-containing protein [Helicobacter suis]|uniref:TonB C-terminal domain-containing protein n=1 Tax=Helicobacter suis TaxID=104628 RepID=UPI0013CFCA90|nr:TonB C-terminal domain-containing protein [Helicobacter suis]
MQNKGFFFASGLLALLCYALLLFLLLQHQKDSPLALPEQTLDVDFINETPKLPSNLNPFKEGLSVKNMFTDLPDKKPSINPKEIQQIKRAQELLRNIQFSQHNKDFKALQESLNQFGNDLKTLQDKHIQLQIPKEESPSSEEDKKWFAQIYKILYAKWKLSFNQKASVGVLITISTTGQLSFSIVQYSPFATYNQEIENLLLSLQKQTFPPNPQKRTITLRVNFKTKD